MTMNRDEVRGHLTGPIASVRVPFDKEGNIDYAGLRAIVDFDLCAGSRTVLLTAGDSHYFCLSDSEIVEITQAVAAQARGQALVVAADRHHATARSVEFARFARDAGCDVVMCLPPDWAQSCTEHTLAEHYAAVACELPVMIVTNLFHPRSRAFGLRTIARALERSQRVVAVKDDICGEFGRRLSMSFHERVALFVGGQKQNHLNAWPYGVDGYLSTFITYRPEVAHRYWQAVEKGDRATEAGIVEETDVPFFDFLMGLPGGWNAGLHGMLELYGLAQRWRRAPYYSLNEAEMERLAAFLRDENLL